MKREKGRSDTERDGVLASDQIGDFDIPGSLAVLDGRRISFEFRFANWAPERNIEVGVEIGDAAVGKRLLGVHLSEVETHAEGGSPAFGKRVGKRVLQSDVDIIGPRAAGRDDNLLEEHASRPVFRIGRRSGRFDDHTLGLKTGYGGENSGKDEQQLDGHSGGRNPKIVACSVGAQQ